MRVEGLSVPYTISTDNTLSLVLLLCSLLSIMIVMRSRNILSLRIRSLFIHTTNLSNYRRTKNNEREELFLTALSVMSLSLIGYSAEPALLWRTTCSQSLSRDGILCRHLHYFPYVEASPIHAHHPHILQHTAMACMAPSLQPLRHLYRDYGFYL